MLLFPSGAAELTALYQTHTRSTNLLIDPPRRRSVQTRYCLTRQVCAA